MLTARKHTYSTQPYLQHTNILQHTKIQDANILTTQTYLQHKNILTARKHTYSTQTYLQHANILIARKRTYSTQKNFRLFLLGPRVMLDSTSVSFGEITSGGSVTRVINITNSSDIDTVFQVTRQTITKQFSRRCQKY